MVGIIMKVETKIGLDVLRDRLQSRLHYWYPEWSLEVLLYGWCKKRKHSTNWLCDVKRRGWLTLASARDFAEYCGYMLV